MSSGLKYFSWSPWVEPGKKSKHFGQSISCQLLVCRWFYLSLVKRICVFEHSVMTNFNRACPAIQRGQGSGFLSKVPLDSLLVRASSEGSGETARMRRLAWTFAARIGDKYQIRLTRPTWSLTNP